MDIEPHPTQLEVRKAVRPWMKDAIRIVNMTFFFIILALVGVKILNPDVWGRLQYFLDICPQENIAANLLPRDVQRRGPVVPKEVMQIDEIYGWRPKPNSTAFSSATGHEVEYSINQHGLRGPDYSATKPDEEFRILFLGNSRTFGFGNRITDHFTHTIEGYFQNVRAINMGVDGYGIDQNLIMLQNAGAQFQPDLVILYAAHYGDHRHMHSQRWGRNKPRFELKDSQLQLVMTQNAKELHHTPQLDQKNVENPEFRKKLYELGAKIVEEIHDHSRKVGAEFILVIGVEDLKKRFSDSMHVVDVNSDLSNRFFALPFGLSHLNPRGNAVLANAITRYLKTNKLVPLKHW